jgi:ankyrin repeat protein
MKIRVIHTHVETGDLVSLRKAIVANPKEINAYQLCQPLETVINRHGLKGTALHLAVVLGNIDKVRVLLEEGANPNYCVVQSERGDEIIPYANAIYIADHEGYQAIANLLKSYSDKSGKPLE